MLFTISRDRPLVMIDQEGEEVQVPAEWRVEQFLAFYQETKWLEVEVDTDPHRCMLTKIHSGGGRSVVNGIHPHVFFGETVTENPDHKNFYDAFPSGSYAYASPELVWWK